MPFTWYAFASERAAWKKRINWIMALSQRRVFIQECRRNCQICVVSRQTCTYHMEYIIGIILYIDISWLKHCWAEGFKWICLVWCRLFQQSFLFEVVWVWFLTLSLIVFCRPSNPSGFRTFSVILNRHLPATLRIGRFQVGCNSPRIVMIVDFFVLPFGVKLATCLLRLC